ncbi:hypothetical protein JCM10207_006330 [Rhodosporidiobolus poonsookiae]
MPRPLVDEELLRVLLNFEADDSDPETAERERRDFYRTFARVCKQWHSLATPLLWQDVDLAHAGTEAVCRGGGDGVARHIKTLRAMEGNHEVEEIEGVLRCTPNLVNLVAGNLLEEDESTFRVDCMRSCIKLRSLYLFETGLEHICSLPSLVQLSLVHVELTVDDLNLLLSPMHTPNLRAVLLSAIVEPNDWDDYSPSTDPITQIDPSCLLRLDLIQYHSSNGWCEPSPWVWKEGPPVLVSLNAGATIPHTPKLCDYAQLYRPRRTGDDRYCHALPPPQYSGPFPPHLELRLDGDRQPDEPSVSTSSMVHSLSELVSATSSASPSNIKSVWLPSWAENLDAVEDVSRRSALQELYAVCERDGVHVGFSPHGPELKLSREFWQWAKERRSAGEGER